MVWPLPLPHQHRIMSGQSLGRLSKLGEEKALCSRTQASQPGSLAPASPEWQRSSGSRDDQHVLRGAALLPHLGHTSHSPQATLAGSDLDSGPSAGPVGPAYCTTPGVLCVDSCICYSEPEWRLQLCRVGKPGRTSWRRSRKEMTLGTHTVPWDSHSNVEKALSSGLPAPSQNTQGGGQRRGSCST